MVMSVILIEGETVEEDDLMSVSLANAMQLVVGHAPGFGTLMHVNATTREDLEGALIAIGGVSGVTGLITLATRQAA